MAHDHFGACVSDPFIISPRLALTDRHAGVGAEATDPFHLVSQHLKQRLGVRRGAGRGGGSGQYRQSAALSGESRWVTRDCATSE